MAGITPGEEADVQDALRHLPDLPHLRLRSEKWSADAFEYARSRIDVDCKEPVRGIAAHQLEQVRAERAQERAADARIAELKAVMNDPKFHWSTAPGFWVAVLALIIAIIALVIK